jgi:hypothetical protein
MAKDWQDFINNLTDELGILAKEELIALVKDTKEDQESFIRRQGEKLELYLSQLATGKITKEQFEGYILDIVDLTRLQARKMRVRAKARAQRLAKNIKKLVIDGLIKVI